MKHLVYKITNNVNSKIYIGVHSTEDINDSYMGSGVNIKKSIAKHGIENFSKDILFIFDSYEEMMAKEAELVDEAFVLRTDTYNAALGGLGAPWKMEHRKDAEELRRKISENTSLGMTIEGRRKFLKLERKMEIVKNKELKFLKRFQKHTVVPGWIVLGRKFQQSIKLL